MTWEEYITNLKEFRDYKTIGTVEECRKAVEKQRAKKPNLEGDSYADGNMVYDTWICPCCGISYEVDYDDYKYCPDCEQQYDVCEKLAAYEDTGLTSEEIMDGKMLTGWTPVEERLPKTEDGYAHVMVSMDDGFVCTTDYTDNDGFELWADSGEVLAWMPLPEPYRPEAGNQTGENGGMEESHETD